MTQSILLILVLIMGFLLKVPALNNPLVGHFGSYQIINAMMADMMNWNSLSSLVIPKTFIMIHGKPALHLLYYPFASFAAFSLHSLLGITVDFWGRFQAAFFMLLSSILVYQIALRTFNRKTALLATFLFTFSPMVLVTGISFQNEAVGLFFLLASYLILIMQPNSLGILFSGFIFSLAVVARIHFLVCFPVFVLVLRQKKSSVKNIVLFSFFAALPLSFWLGFTYYLDKTSDHVMTSFFSQVSEGRVLKLSSMFHSSFYRRLLDIVIGEWLTPILFPFAFISLFNLDQKKAPFILWALCTLSMIVLIPEKVTNHSFYLICGVPAACILAAIFLDSISSSLNRVSWTAFFVLFFLLTLRYYLPVMLSPSQMSFSIIPELGRKIEQSVDKDAKIIASYGSSPELLYYSKHCGWPFGVGMSLAPSESMSTRHRQAMELGYGDPVKWLEYLRTEGAQYLVIGEPEAFQARTEFNGYVRSHYREISTGNDHSFLIFDVTKQT